MSEQWCLKILIWSQTAFDNLYCFLEADKVMHRIKKYFISVYAKCLMILPWESLIPPFIHIDACYNDKRRFFISQIKIFLFVSILLRLS